MTKKMKPKTSKSEVRFVLFDTFNETYVAFKTKERMEEYIEEEYANAQDLSVNQLLVAEINTIQAVKIEARSRVDGYILTALNLL